jgi:hypothetical protein
MASIRGEEQRCIIGYETEVEKDEGCVVMQNRKESFLT